MSPARIAANDKQAPSLLEMGDVLDVGVLRLDQELIVTGWNAWLEKATGKRAVDVLGRALCEVEPHLRPATQASLKQAVNGATVILSQRLHGFLIDAPAPAGCEQLDRMQQSVRVLPLYHDSGAPCGAVALIQDVSDRVAREEELRAALDQAQLANRAKSDFLAAMSHELRTPIGAITSYADLLADGLFGPVADTQRERLLRIKVVAGHLLGIVEQILTAARVEAGREKVRLGPADGIQIVREAIMAVQPLVETKGLQLHTRLGAESIPMHTDAIKVRQILINLLGNAVKFTDCGSISIDVDLSPDGSRVAFRVADTGVGIAADDLELIFEPFVQVAPSTVRPHEGTGLGLSVSRELTRLLGGDLTVASELGAGSVFTAGLPVVSVL